MIRLLRQKGIALIQVLLISFMLIILVVQLSKDSRQQVKTALELKEKAIGLIKATSALEHSKFILLTEQRAHNMTWEGSEKINFFGKAIAVETGVTVAFQDEAGLISLPYDESGLLQWLNGNRALLTQIRKWQGTSESDVSALSDGRNGLMPQLEEVKLLPGWQNVELEGLTHLPTAYFSISGAPENVIQKTHPQYAQQIIEARNNGGLNVEFISGLGASDISAVDIGPPSQITRVKVVFGDEYKIERNRKFMVEPAAHTPIIDLSL